LCEFWIEISGCFIFYFLSGGVEEGRKKERRGAYWDFFSVGKRRGFSKGNGDMNIPPVQVLKGEIEAAISPVKNQKGTYF